MANVMEPDNLAIGGVEEGTSAAIKVAPRLP
jgi:hypothetical protein